MRKREKIWIIAWLMLLMVLCVFLAMAAVEKLYATAQSCTPGGSCTVTNGANTLGPEDGLTGSAAGRWPQDGLVWDFTMNDSLRPGTFVSANITIYNFNLSWVPNGGSDTILLQYCVGVSCFTLYTFTSANASDPVQNLTYVASQISSFDNANNTIVRFAGGTKNQGPDTMTVILDAVSLDVEFTPPTISSASSFDLSTIFALESTNLTGHCNCTGAGTCEDVFMTVQDNRTGTFTDSTTSTTADVFVNITTYNIGNIATGSFQNKTFNVTANTAGNYDFRIVCNSTNALGSPANSATQTLTVNPNVYITTVASPNTSFPAQINAGDNISIGFNFTKNGNEINSEIAVDNITVGGFTCTELPGLVYDSGAGEWVVNCTTSTSLTTGLHDLFILANYTPDPGVDNHTALQAVNATALTPPAVNSIVIDEAPPVGEINLLAGGQTAVFCNASVSDVNGAGNIVGANATFYYSGADAADPDNNNTHYTNNSCTSTASAGDVKNFTCGFNVLYYAVNGTWECNVTAFDQQLMWNSTVNTTTINPLFALNTSTSLINYTEASINTTSIEVEVNITNIGNQPINVSVWGYGGDDPATGDGLAMVCPVNNITIGNERFSTASSPYTSKISLSSVSQSLGYTIPKQTSPTLEMNQTFWQIFVPNLDPPLGNGICNGSVVIQAEQA